MKKLLFFTLLVFGSLSVLAQSESVSSVGSLNIVKEVKPPILSIVGQVALVEPSGNNAIDANESCVLRMKIKNDGLGDGYSLKGKMTVKSGGQGISVRDISLPTIKVGATQTVDLPITANINTVDGTVVLEAYIDEPNGFGTEPLTVRVPTRAFLAPMVEFRGHLLTGGAVTLSKTKVYTMQVFVQNTGRGAAESVNVALNLPDNVMLVESSNELVNATLASGESRTIDYKFIINQKYSKDNLEMTVSVDERYHRYTKNGKIKFDVNAKRNNDIVIDDVDEPVIDPVPLLTLDNDINFDIPQSMSNNANTRVMIIANQSYMEEQAVSTALSDGRVMREYCVKTLGIPANQVELLENRTSAQMKADVEAFAKTMRINNGDRFLFFYFGHGMHDQDLDKKDAYLIPVDGSSQRLRQTGVSRNWMMAQFEKSKPSQMVVYLESCFSGATASDGMLNYAEGSSGLRLSDAVDNSFKGNIILLTASSQRETANALKTHNVFTYEFLRALKETRGDINWGELFSRVKSNTTSKAWNELKRDQTPSVTVSTTLGDSWKNWKLK